VTTTAAPTSRRTQSIFWRRFRKSTPGKIGAFIVLVFVALALLAPVIKPYDPRNEPSNYTQRLKPPSSEHIFGTDNLGRDVAVRILHGARISLVVGILSTLVAMVFGSLFGILAGYFGGWFDTVVGYVSDILLAFPGILLAIIITAIIPLRIDPNAVGLVANTLNFLQERNVDLRLFGAMLAVSIVAIPVYVRLARSVVLSVREREFVQAAGALGAGQSRIIFRHVLPNSLTPLIVQGSLSIATATIEVAALGFLGLGATPPAPEWGTMISDAKDYYQTAPWTMVFPGLAILLTVLGFNLLGDGLRDVLDPRSTQ